MSKARDRASILSGATFTGAIAAPAATVNGIAAVEHGVAEYFGVFRSPAYASLRIGPDAANGWQLQVDENEAFRFDRLIAGNVTQEAVLTDTSMQVGGSDVLNAARLNALHNTVNVSFTGPSASLVYPNITSSGDIHLLSLFARDPGYSQSRTWMIAHTKGGGSNSQCSYAVLATSGYGTSPISGIVATTTGLDITMSNNGDWVVQSVLLWVS